MLGEVDQEHEVLLDHAQLGFEGAEAISNEQLLVTPCDVLVPAAMERQITAENAAKILGNEKFSVVTRYYARLVPTAWLLTLARTNRVFLGQTVKQIATEVLTGYKLTEGTHFDLHADGTWKDMKTGEQKAVKQDDLIHTIQA